LEPVTHLLTGACIARAGLNRTTGLATLTVVLASEAPDGDFVSAIGGSVSYLQHHRGITHTLMGAPFVAAVVLAVVYGIYRLLLRRGRPPKLAPNWKLLYLYAVMAAVIHIFLDFTNSYGVRPFAPFNWKWYSWDILYIVDPVILTILVLSLAIPGLLGLVSEEIGARKSPRGRAAAIFALVCFAAVIYVRDFEHRRAVNLLESVTYANEDARRVSAFPTMLSPFSWNGVIETRDFFEIMDVMPRAGEIDPEGTARPIYKPEETAVTEAAKKSRLGRVYLGWAQYPLVEAERLADNQGYTVQFTDLRFRRPDDTGQRSVLTGYVVLDPKLKVVAMYVGRPKPD
jgi:inner membrane protein